MQTRTMSLVESLTNVVVGLVVSLISQLVIFHAYDIKLTIDQNLEIVLWFTLISIVRSYALRRFFNGLRAKL